VRTGGSSAPVDLASAGVSSSREGRKIGNGVAVDADLGNHGLDQVLALRGRAGGDDVPDPGGAARRGRPGRGCGVIINFARLWG
jgi:hypothetical protein